jgi:hypothetical protein
MKNHLFQKFATLIVICLIAGCASTSATWEKKETYSGIRDMSIDGDGILAFKIDSYHLMKSSDGKQNWISGASSNTYYDIQITWSLNPELREVYVRTGNYGIKDIKKQILKANPKSEIKITCLSCSNSDMPTQLLSNLARLGDFVYRELTSRKLSGEYRVAIQEKEKLVLAEKKKQMEEVARKTQKAAIEGDGSGDDLTCKSFGFKPQTSGYSDCRLKLEVASRQAAQQQAQYDEQKRQYDAQLAEQKRQRQVGAGLALMQMGSGLLAPPAPPLPANQTIVTPSGRIVNCHTTGTVTNCF